MHVPKGNLSSYVFTSQDPVIKLYDHIPNELNNPSNMMNEKTSQWIALYSSMNFLTETVESDPDFLALLDMWIRKVVADLIPDIDLVHHASDFGRMSLNEAMAFSISTAGDGENWRA